MKLEDALLRPVRDEQDPSVSHISYYIPSDEAANNILKRKISEEEEEEENEIDSAEVKKKEVIHFNVQVQKR